jgi:large subunit ribosomal protein L1
LVLCNPDKEADAKNAGADYVGLDEYITKIKNGWTDVDVIIATPDVMAKIGAIGRILGPRNLMPNPKTGTVTTDVAAAVADVKKGKISFRVDKYGIIHSTVGRVSFTANQLVENVKELMSTLERMKPSTAKGVYVRSVSVATTMSPGVKIDPKSV